MCVNLEMKVKNSENYSGRAKYIMGVCIDRAQRSSSTSHGQRDHQEIIFPVTLVDPISEIAEVWHTLFVDIKLINLTLRAEIISMQTLTTAGQVPGVVMVMHQLQADGLID